MAFATKRAATVAATKKVGAKKGGRFGTKKVAPKKAASADRPVWFPGAVPPPWLDGACARAELRRAFVRGDGVGVGGRKGG